MSHQRHPNTAAAAFAALMLLATPLPSLGESGHGGQSASASVRIRVVVQPYVQILRNSHPAVLSAQGGNTVTAEQQLSIRTNQAHGFCIDLIAADLSAPPTQWHVQASAGDPIALSPQGNGYRLCGHRPGSHAFTLVHRFQFEGSQQTTEPAWPLLASIAQP